jgi:hypothetical protein
VENDGLVFDLDSLEIEEIREAQEYGGWRASMRVTLGTARIPLQIDVAFGDAIIPGIIELKYPALLTDDGPRIRAYPVETMIAEKVEAIVKLGIVNSRMKDFYDVIIISEDFDLVAGVLKDAVRATFTRRETPLPTERPIGLTDEFAAHQDVAWKAFLRTNDLQDVPQDLSEAIMRIRAFIWPVLQAAAQGIPLAGRWVQGEGWTK